MISGYPHDLGNLHPWVSSNIKCLIRGGCAYATKCCMCPLNQILPRHACVSYRINRTRRPGCQWMCSRRVRHPNSYDTLNFRTASFGKFFDIDHVVCCPLHEQRAWVLKMAYFALAKGELCWVSLRAFGMPNTPNLGENQRDPFWVATFLCHPEKRALSSHLLQLQLLKIVDI